MKTCKQYRDQAWDALQGHRGESAAILLVICFISGIVSGPASILSALQEYMDISNVLVLTMSGISTIFSLLVVAPLQWANLNAILDVVSRKNNPHVFPTTWKIFKREFSTLLPAYLLVGLIIFGIVIAVFVAFVLIIYLATLLVDNPVNMGILAVSIGILPACVAAVLMSLAYAMVPFIIHDNPEIGIAEALRTSRKMMEGHKAKLFLLNFSFIGWILLSLLTFFIAFLWIQPFIYSATAAFYEDVKNPIPDDADPTFGTYNV